MDFSEYQSLAQRTQNLALEKETTLVTAALGLAGESGEVADHVKKFIGQGHHLDKNKLVEELGDLLWYVALASTALETDLEEIANINILKLKLRYPDGFSTDRSVNR